MGQPRTMFQPDTGKQLLLKIEDRTGKKTNMEYRGKIKGEGRLQPLTTINGNNTGRYCLLSEDGSSRSLRNVGNHLQNWAALQSVTTTIQICTPVKTSIFIKM